MGRTLRARRPSQQQVTTRRHVARRQRYPRVRRVDQRVQPPGDPGYEPGSTRYLLSVGVCQTTHASATTHPRPPLTTEAVAPKACATSPASSSPSWGPPMKKIMFTLVMRPRIESGVFIWRITLRITMLTVSVTPVRARQAKVSQNARE